MTPYVLQSGEIAHGRIQLDTITARIVSVRRKIL